MKKCTISKLTLMVLVMTISISVKAQHTWEYLEPLPTPRGLCSSAVMGGKIYIIGGFYDVTKEATPTILIFDPVTQSWDTTMADLPVPLGNVSAGVVNGKLYVTGGQRFVSGNEIRNTVWEYDPADNTWRKKAPMQKHRFYHQTAVINDKMIVMGGRAEPWPAPIDSSMEMYDPATDTWTFLANLPYNPATATVEVIDGKMYVFGGVDRFEVFANVTVYNPETNTWAELPNLPTPRTLHGSGIIDELVYIFGGASTVALPDMWSWDFKSDWRDVDVLMSDTVGAFVYAVATDETGKECFYAIGGVRLDYWSEGSVGPYTSDAVRKYCPITTSTDDIEKTPTASNYYQIYPNPMNANTKIQYVLKKTGRVVIKIFAVSGQEILTVLDADQLAGNHETNWNSGKIPSGMYYCTLWTEQYTVSKKVVVLK